MRAWLIVTARNTAINRYRALQRHDTLPLTDELAATIADLPADPAGDAADELAVLVAALEPPDREIFLRKYYLMQSSREIAPDLRGGAALLLAALGAEGVTLLRDPGHIPRGYADLPGDLRTLGADCITEKT